MAVLKFLKENVRMWKIFRTVLYCVLIAHMCVFMSGCGLLLIGAGTGAYLHGRNLEKQKNGTE